MSQQLSANHAAVRVILLQKARQHGWPLTIQGKHGGMAYLRAINERGYPIYTTTTDNIISAATIRTNTLWPGGTTGLNLNGSSANMTGRIAVWDAGEVRLTHVELAGRVTQDDGSTDLQPHSTHVAGTMIASGVNPLARGMSWGTQHLHAYDYNNDMAEMAAAASGAGGIIVSNHSYADIAGWYENPDENNRWEWWGEAGDTVDIKFGLYDADTRTWDSIAYVAPYYLICKAGGNNLSEQGPAVGQPYYRYDANQNMVSAGNRPTGISNNGGYNTISTYGNAKNILVLGAVNPIPGGYSKPSDVVLAGFSSLGPTGDGRIKPDVVADGVNVLSSVSSADNAYDIYSGTSMASPATAGSAYLLQEYYSKLHGSFMYSATLRGLIIHTADEAGLYPGPDYAYGWGLVDIQKAAAVITADNTDHSQSIIQSSLVQGSKDDTSFFVVASGKMPISATICWTDVPGTPATIPANSHNFKDVNPKLVNDLDLRIANTVTGQIYQPWVLNPSSPGSAATRGDNFRDNVERVDPTDTVIPGATYTITVTHKGALQTGGQAYSLVYSGGGGTAYCTSGSSSSGTAISNVTVSNLNNTDGIACGKAYADFTGLAPVQLSVGSTVPISIGYQNCVSATTNIAVYIDANCDGVFDPVNELVLSQHGVNNASGSPFNGSIVVPANAKVGSFTRMRVIASDNASATTPAPCNPYPSGETQDYRVVFTNPANDVGVSAMEYPTITACATDSQLVAVHIHNYGTTNQAAGVPVTTVVKNGVTTVKTFTGLCTDSIPAGGEVVFTYNSVFPTTAGQSYTFTSYTALSSDVYKGNDTLTGSATISPAEAPGQGSATACGANTTSVVLHADASGNDVAVWYDGPASTTPIAAGNNTTTTEITSNKTYYLGLNDLTAKAGPSGKNAAALATTSQYNGAYFRVTGNFIQFSTYVPLTIESAKMYIGHSGQIDYTLAQFFGYFIEAGQYKYSYLPVYSGSIDVYPTKAHPNNTDTSRQVNVLNTDNSDTGAYFLLNIPVPNPGDYILIVNAQNYATAFLNSNIKKDPYPFTMPGVLSIEGNDMIDHGKPDSITYSHGFYYPFYDIAIKLGGCTASGRTAVTATTEPAPTISQQGNTFVSSFITGNQWYLNDSLMTDSTAMQITPSLPGVYYTIVNDANTGCMLRSNSIVYQSNAGDPNTRIGLHVGPVPSPGPLNVSFYMSNSASLSIVIYDLLGRKVWEQDYGQFSGFFQNQLNTTLASGFYTIKIFHGSDTYKLPIVIDAHGTIP